MQDSATTEAFLDEACKLYTSTKHVTSSGGK